MARVGIYINMEYGPDIYKEYCKRENLQTIHDFVGGYYLTGYSVPDVAWYCVSLIRSKFFNI